MYKGFAHPRPQAVATAVHCAAVPAAAADELTTPVSGFAKGILGTGSIPRTFHGDGIESPPGFFSSQNQKRANRWADWFSNMSNIQNCVREYGLCVRIWVQLHKCLWVKMFVCEHVVACVPL